MKIDVKSINLKFYPSYSVSTDSFTSNFADVKLQFELVPNINIENNNPFWQVIHIDYDDAKLIHDMAMDKAIALVNIRHKTLSHFAKMKVETFSDLKPTSNWETYNELISILKEREEVEAKYKKIRDKLYDGQIHKTNLFSGTTVTGVNMPITLS